MKVLVVTNPFGGHEKGHRITDSAEIDKILAGEHAHHVVQADHDIEMVEQPAGHQEAPPEQPAENHNGEA